jgi:hypothetical protein
MKAHHIAVYGSGLLLVTLILFFFVCFKLYDTTPYPKTEAWKKQQEALRAIHSIKETSSACDTLQIGWAKVNLLPFFTTPIAIDAHRHGKHFEGVHDSIYVRAFVFKSGNRKVAYIAADLLIIPPNVRNAFDTLMKKEGFDNDNIFFTATHTHSSIGSWYNSLVGEIFAGKYDERVPAHIAACIREAIRLAEQNTEPAEVGYGVFPTTKLVFNRLIGQEGRVDSLLRIVKFRKLRTGKTAALLTFSAHATVYHESMMQICGDWPNQLKQQLEEFGMVDFACFSAGAVGSHGPYEVSKLQEVEAAYIVNGVRSVFESNFNNISIKVLVSDSFPLKMMRMQLFLREPNLRLNSVFSIRSWLFRKLFGNERVYLTQLCVGNIRFLGTPCDFSGELTAEIDLEAAKNGLNAVVTSFNGGYIGYVTNDKWNHLNRYETKTMNWFGPQTGSYMQQIMIQFMSN